jgi:amino acid adenylation domain-containing protein
MSAAAHQLFLESFLRQVAERPAGVAARFGEEKLSYAELDEASAALGAELARNGVGRNDFVPVLVGRSLHLPVAILGVLRAGAAYVPVERHWPAARLREVFSQVRAEAVVVDAETEALLSPGQAFVRADQRRPPISAEPTASAPGDAAYVMFTSGSTGEPKGIVIEHGALAGFLGWARGYFELDPDSRVIQFSRLTFDASVWEIFGALSCGGTLVLVTENEAESPLLLSEALMHHRITHCDIVPSVLAMLEPKRAVALRQCMSGGERILGELVEQWATTERTFVNGYGPAEATVVSIAARCVPGGPGPVPIGAPIEGVTAYLLDEQLVPVTPGEVGELFLGGGTLARGYVGMPRETAGRFIPDPFGGEPGRRMYRTGDLARQLEDGTFAFVGRRDRQVKIAGQRVEPEEVETVLAGLPGVDDCAVVAVERSGRRRLVAFLTGEASAGDVDRECRARLPGHLVPSAFEVLPELPLGSSGKIDRSALAAHPTAVASRPAAAAPGVHAGAEGIFLEAVADVFGFAPSPDRSFVEAGGDSLDAMRLIARLPPELGRRLTVRGVLQAGSLEEAAAALGEEDGAGARLPPLEPVAGEPWPLSQSQLGMLLSQGLEPDLPTYNVCTVVDFEGGLHLAALTEAVRRLVSRQQTLSRTVELDWISGTASAKLCPPPSLELHDEVDLAGAEAILREQARRPFDLESGPPIRFTCLALGPDRHRLLVLAHHVAADGWSVSVLAEELARHYADALEGADAMPPLALDYGDYAAWESQLLVDGATDEGVEAWSGLLSSYPRVLRIGGDREAKQDAPPGARGSVEVELDPGATGAAQELAAAHGASPFMVLLTAFARVVGARTGLKRFLIGCPMATRFDWRLEEVVGNFVNVLPIPIDLGGDPDFGAQLEAVSEAANEAYRLRHVPFGQIVKRMQLPADERSRPLVQVAFQVEEAIRAPAFPGLVTQIEDVRPDSIAVDLECRLLERAGRLSGAADFDSSIYSEIEVRGLVSEFTAVVAALRGATGKRRWAPQGDGGTRY